MFPKYSLIYGYRKLQLSAYSLMFYLKQYKNKKRVGKKFPVRGSLSIEIKDLF